MANIVEKLRPIIQELVESQGICLYDIEFVKEDGIDFLRVSIEKDDHSMDFETAEVISNLVSAKLDELDPIDHEYILDVCSAGIERPLKTKEDFKSNVNNYITINLSEEESYTGDLLAFENDVITIAYKEKTRTIKKQVKYEDIISAHIAIKF